MKFSIFIFILVATACGRSSSDDSTVQSKQRYPNSLVGWLNYEDITEEQQHTLDVIFESQRLEKNKANARKLSNETILDVSTYDVQNLDPIVFGMKKLVILYFNLHIKIANKENCVEKFWNCSPISELEKLNNLKTLVISTENKCPRSFERNSYAPEICLKR